MIKLESQGRIILCGGAGMRGDILRIYCSKQKTIRPK